MMTLLEAAAPIQSPTPVRLYWPTPHHFKIVEDPANDRPEQGIVVMCDGRKLAGTVARLDTSASVLEFQPEQARANLMIAFSEFKSLFLSGTTQLHAHRPRCHAETGWDRKDPPGAHRSKASSSDVPVEQRRMRVRLMIAAQTVVDGGNCSVIRGGR
jgi:hypothetical protein